MDFTDPFNNFQENIEITGFEPVLGGQLAEKLYGLMSLSVLVANTVYMSLRILSLLMNFMVEVEL